MSHDLAFAIQYTIMNERVTQHFFTSPSLVLNIDFAIQCEHITLQTLILSTYIRKERTKTKSRRNT